MRCMSEILHEYNIKLIPHWKYLWPRYKYCKWDMDSLLYSSGVSEIISDSLRQLFGCERLPWPGPTQRASCSQINYLLWRFHFEVPCISWDSWDTRVPMRQFSLGRTPASSKRLMPKHARTLNTSQLLTQPQNSIHSHVCTGETQYNFSLQPHNRHRLALTCVRAKHRTIFLQNKNRFTLTYVQIPRCDFPLELKK